MSNNNRLFAAKKPCNKCGGLISWDQKIRESIPTNLPLNLDRTVHDRASCERVKLEHPGLSTETIGGGGEQHEHQQKILVTSPIPHPTSYEADKREEIREAHDENMAAAKATKESIDALCDAVLDTRQELHEMNTNIKTLANIITAYIEQK